MKLRLGIQRVGSIVFGRVLVQDDALRCKAVLACGGNVIQIIRSNIDPAIGQHTIYIRGSIRDGDCKWFAHDFKDSGVALQAVKDIKLLVAKVNEVEQHDEPDDCGLEIIE